MVIAEVDLEDAMISPEESDKQEDKQKMGESEGYGKVYTKTHEKRAKRSMSRVEKKVQDEQRRKQAARKAAKAQADKCVQDEAQRLIEKQWLEEDQMVVQKKIDRKCKLQDQTDKEKVTKGGSSITLKQEWNEKLGLKAKK